MKDAGSALMGIGRATGDNRALDATRQAIASPLLEISINGAQGILFNVSGSSNLSLFEVTEAAEEIRSVADPEANIIFGTSFDDRLGDEVLITVIATGFDSSRKRDSVRREAGAATPGAGYSQRMDTADFLADLERQRIHSAEPVPVYARGAGTYGATGALERTPVAVPIQTSQSVRRPPVDRPRPTYDDTDLEIPSFLRRPPQEEQG
jgi:cell division protein FtsZ